MEIKRIGENQVRCALTEEEIQAMGFEIDDIIGDSEMTQKFMRDVLEIIEERENINMEKISPMVRAELLQDHSMAITFGGETELSFKDLLETVNRLMNQLNPERMEKFRTGTHEEKRQLIESMLSGVGKDTAGREKKESSSEDRYGKGIMTCAVYFYDLEEVIAMCKKCDLPQKPKSSLYKFEGDYYLLLDFEGFTKEQMRPYALCFVEYDEGHISDNTQLAELMEHGECMIKKDALSVLTEL